MFHLVRDAELAAYLKIEQELRSQIVIRDSQIANLHDEIAQLKGKIDRMELVLMPLASKAGALYVAAMTPGSTGEKPKPTLAPADLTTSWQAYLKSHMQENERLDKLEAENKAKEGN